MKEQLKILEKEVEMLFSSLCFATSEVLGFSEEQTDSFFKVSQTNEDGEDCMVVVGPDEFSAILVPISLLKLDTDKDYYPDLKNFVESVKQDIPENEIDLPVDEWPEPAGFEDLTKKIEEDLEQ